MAQIEWHNEKRAIHDLIPYVANPRQITEKQAKDLKASLERFGIADPLIINTDDTIIGGHQRKKILETLMGYDPDYQIDVRVPDRELGIDEVRELNVRLNKNVAEWNFDTLANNFELDDLRDWGFEERELKLQDYTYNLNEYSVLRKISHIDQVALGCYSACQWVEGESKDYEAFLKWKANPSENKRKTIEMAKDLYNLIDTWCRGWRDFIITSPPQGSSILIGQEYPAGMLSKKVAYLLKVDYVTVFEPWEDIHKGHHPKMNIQRITPPTLKIMPDIPVVIVDDMMSSGNTAKLSLEALYPNLCWFFVWINGQGRRPVLIEEI